MTTAQAFAIKICLSIGLGFWFILWSNPLKWREALDIYLGTALGAVIGARVVFVLLNIKRFLDTPANIPRLWYGELAWQGIFIGAGIAFALMLRWRKTPFHEVADGFAWAIPIILIGVCWAARSAGLILGDMVADIKNHPVWEAGFLPALDRDVQPRYELQMLGISLGAGILLLIGLLSFMNWLSEARFWLALSLCGLAIFALDRFTANQSQLLYGLQIDQISAGIIFLLGLGMGTLTASVKRRADTLLNPLSDQL